MYAQVEKVKKNTSNVNQVIRMDGLLGGKLNGNTPNTTRKTSTRQKEKRGTPGGHNKAGPKQLYKVPAGLEALLDDVKATQAAIRQGYDSYKGVNDDIHGGEEWAQDTRTAALRKLSEWEGAELAQKIAVRQNLTTTPCFGVSDKDDPDAAAVTGTMDPKVVVEQKYVTGKFEKQMEKNMENAFKQLCTGRRSGNYNNVLLTVLMIVPEGSEAFKGWAALTQTGLSRIEKKWDNRLAKYKKIESGKNQGNSVALVVRVGRKDVYTKSM